MICKAVPFTCPCCCCCCCCCQCCCCCCHRFSDCLHLAEPGCAVTPHAFERYEHYLKFLAEIKVKFAAAQCMLMHKCSGLTALCKGVGGAVRCILQAQTPYPLEAAGVPSLYEDQPQNIYFLPSNAHSKT